MDEKHSNLFGLLTTLLLLCFFSISVASETNITTDQSALITLKTHITSDPYRFLESWSIQSPVCNWTGVTCGKRHPRITKLDISSMDLTGGIPPELGNLSFLVSFDISTNNFGTTLPKNLVSLRRLRFMYLDHNNFIGEFPSWISSFPRLQDLSLQNNHFTSLDSFLLSSTNESKLEYLNVSSNPFHGEIPKSIGNLRNLKVLVMQNNGLSGSIPASIMNISGLLKLSLKNNSLKGVIPEVIGNLHNLNILGMQQNQLIGPLPSSIFNNSMLKVVRFTYNNLSGTLPNDMCHRAPTLKVLALSFNDIHGHIPANISSCYQLQAISLSYNRITGPIPQEIESLAMLEILYLGGNLINGQIPSPIGKLHNLQEFALEDNLVTGSIPLTISNMSSLQVFSLRQNKLHGILSDNFGNLTMLKMLVLSENNFTGVIPRAFHKLTKLETLLLAFNRLSGSIPSEIFNITTIEVIDFTANSLSGRLPKNIGISLPNLEGLYLGDGNTLVGVLPSSISNSSLLKQIDLALNKFTGSIPKSLGDLKFLQALMLHVNNFTSESPSSELGFITSLTSCRYLTRLHIDANPLNGALPISVGNFSSSLQHFTASTSQIKGYIPKEMGNLSGLMTLNFTRNGLIGEIPAELGKLSNLQLLSLENNQLVGRIPDEICKMKSLGIMLLGQNNLLGSIPECLEKLSFLRYIHLNSNNLTFEIPNSIWNLQYLLELNISSNSLIGSLSPQIGNLKVATLVDLSMNQFSKDIPNNFGDLKSVTYLSLAYNLFEGSIPDSIGSMLSLESLDLSHNTLSGVIPKSFELLTDLLYFNVSSNELSGEIPTNGPFKNLSGQSFAFNNALCGLSKFQVLPCKKSRNSSQKKKIFLSVFIVLGFGSLVVVGATSFLIFRCRGKKKPLNFLNVHDIARPQRMSYYEVIKATNGCSDENLLGRGSFGSVYKGVLEDGTILAIKVFNMLLEVTPKIFDAECNVLRKLRHRNLIKVVGSCSNQDFKAIILEYMPNGNLENALYSNDHLLDIIQRLDIMIEVANALEYLHYGYSETVVHCDLKPSNVLLDSNMVAHVSDFRITKLLNEEEDITHTRTLATLGYMAPEYGSEGRVSTKCDVYSYGIMLLEMLTRKRPSDEMFSGDLTLRSWVNDSLPNTLSKVIDESLISPGEINFNEKLCCTSSTLELALRCCADTPKERMNMKDVVVELKKIKTRYISMDVPQTRR